MDILVNALPKYVNRFVEGAGEGRDGSSVAAMALDFNVPGHYDVFKVERELYSKLTSRGVILEDILKFFDAIDIKHEDLSNLVGDMNTLYDKIEEQNRAGYVHLLLVEDGSLLLEAVTGEKLHNWPDASRPAYILRVGFSDTDGYGFYLDPSAPGFCKDGPVKISWSKSIELAKIVSCVAVAPYVKPVVQPPIDKSRVQAILQAAQAQLAAHKVQLSAHQDTVEASEAIVNALSKFVADLDNG